MKGFLKIFDYLERKRLLQRERQKQTTERPRQRTKYVLDHINVTMGKSSKNVPQACQDFYWHTFPGQRNDNMTSAPCLGDKSCRTVIQHRWCNEISSPTHCDFKHCLQNSQRSRITTQNTNHWHPPYGIFAGSCSGRSFTVCVYALFI